jgi:hemerythrin-like domain-containing protein
VRDPSLAGFHAPVEVQYPILTSAGRGRVKWARDRIPSASPHAGEPEPDLRDYRVVHRAMTVDLQRLAAAAADLVDRPDPARMAALRYYLRVVSAEIESHHHVEDEDVWPFLEAVAGDRTALVPLTEDHEQLDPLLHRANELAAREVADPELVGVLREVADLLTRHVAAEERDIFPIITERVRVADYERLQKRFRATSSRACCRSSCRGCCGTPRRRTGPRCWRKPGGRCAC